MSSIAQPVARSVSRSVLAGQRMNLGYLIRSMFSNSEQGFAYDPNDLTTLYQDAAGTIPVTGAGQPVAMMTDISGNNHIAIQTQSGLRPPLQKDATTGYYYLWPDGADDFLVISAVNFTATDKLSLFIAERTEKLNALSSLIETGSNYTNPTGGFGYFTPGVASTEASAKTISGGISGGGGYWNFGIVNTNSGWNRVSTMQFDMSSAIKDQQAKIRVNGVQLPTPTSATTVVVGSKFGNNPVYIGRRNGTSIPFGGRIYGIVCIGRLTTASETLAIEREFAKRVGVVL